ncbi:MAG: HAMP domain-containing protein [Chitinophagaceae bacterium]|nr:HAMP domain-containing protein [Anaerolineae bacterium]
MLTGLQRRFTIIFVLLTVIPLVFLSLLVGFISFTNLQQESQEGLISTSESVSEKIEQYITARTDELNLLINLTGLSEENAALLLQNLLFRTDLYEEIALLDAEGNETVLLSRRRVIEADKLTSRAETLEFTSIRDGDPVHYSDVIFSAEVREPLMTISLPVNNLRSGELQAVLVVEFRFRPIWQQLTDLKLTDSTIVYLIDADTMGVIAHPDPSVVLRETAFSVTEAFGRGVGLSENDVLFGSQTIQLGNKTLITVAEQPTNEALASAQQLVTVTLITTFLTLVVTIVVVTITVRQVVRPIRKLSEVAKQIQAGDLSLRADVRSKDEIGDLATSFDQMTDRLVYNINELDTHIEELNETNDALRAATAKAREASRVKGEFLANVSHELRTPLNSIIGFSDMLLMGMSGDMNPKQRHKMERLKENGVRLLTLINNILDITRIEARRVEIVNKPVALRALADRLSAQMSVLAERSGLEFKTRIDAQLPELLMADEERLEQIVVNLLSNAFKFTEKGLVTMDFDMDVDKNCWQIIVTDTGMGIPPHALNLIFEEFRQVDGSSSRAFKGSGLGLAITRNLVRIMDGFIIVESELGQGSKFIVTFPLLTERTTHSEALEKVVA